MGNLIGQTLGRYHILEQLGEGGMAVVYKAFDTRLERHVAIKVILPSKEHSEKFLKRFEREAKSLAQLSHPNIVKVIDYGEHEGLPYLVMEYLSGGTLKQKLAGKSMPWQEAARILIPIARALAYAHERKIVHRDIKSSNILITESGEPMLSDFGIAKMLEAEETLDLTGTGIGVGTPEYMSPEQAQGQPVDGRSDVYSLGVVLYEIVTGRKPYQADTPYAVVIKQVNEPLPRPTQFVKELPKDLEGILLKALAKNPANRYHSMNGFAEALTQLRSQKLTLRPRPEIRKFPTRVFLGAALGVLLLVAGWWGFQNLKTTFPPNQTRTPVVENTSTALVDATATANARATSSAHSLTATAFKSSVLKRGLTATANAKATSQALAAFKTVPLLFTKGNCIPSEWATSGVGSWKCDNNIIVGHSDQGNAVLLSNERYKNVYLEAVVSAQNREASLAVRMRDENSGYLIIFLPDNSAYTQEGNLAVVKRVNGQETNLVNGHPSNFPKAGQSVKLAVLISGNSIQVFMNDRLVLRANDNTFSSGMIGLRIFGYDDVACDATFTNLVVKAE